MGLFFPSGALGQGLVDMSTPRPEYPLTQGMFATGDVYIYMSCPNWFPMKTGYQPLSFRVTPKKGTFRSDGTLRISLKGVGNYYDQTERTSSVEISFQKGASEARGELLANFFTSLSVTTKVLLNGRELKGQEAYFYNGGRQQDEFPLFVISEESATYNTRQRDALAAMKSSGAWFAQASDDQFERTSAYVDANKLPTNWLFYQGASALYIRESDLKFLSADAVETLNHYVLAGGVLVINNAQTLSGTTPYFPIEATRTIENDRTSTANRTDASKGSNPATGARNSQIRAPVVSQISVSDFTPSLDPFPSTVWDKFQRETVRSLIQRNNYRPAPVWQPGFTLINFDNTVQNFSRSSLDVAKAYADFRLTGTMVMASRFFDTLSRSKGLDPNAPDRIKDKTNYAYGFGAVCLDPANRREWSTSSDISVITGNKPMIFRSDRFWWRHRK